MKEADHQAVSHAEVSLGAHSRPATAGSEVPVTAFVLSGGASLAAAQVGMLHALYERGVEPDFLVGTSAGAINAAFVASRPQNTATANTLGRIWRDLRREDVFPVSMTALVGGVSGRRDHLVPDRGLRQLVRRHLEFGDLADAPIPLYLVGFDLNEGREVLLSEGPAVDAVAASASIPGIFPPVELGERRVVDGGVVNNTPISHAVALGADRIYVLSAQNSSQPVERPAKSALDAAIYGLGLLIGSRLESDIARYSREAELVVLPAPNSACVQPTSFEHSGALINEALAAARAVLGSRSGPRHLRLVSEVDDAVRSAEREPGRRTALRTAGPRPGYRPGRAEVEDDVDVDTREPAVLSRADPHSRANGRSLRPSAC